MSEAEYEGWYCLAAEAWLNPATAVGFCLQTMR